MDEKRVDRYAGDYAKYSHLNEQQLHGLIRRGNRRIDKIENEYGSMDIPKSNPLHAKREKVMDTNKRMSVHLSRYHTDNRY